MKNEHTCIFDHPVGKEGWEIADAKVGPEGGPLASVRFVRYAGEGSTDGSACPIARRTVGIDLDKGIFLSEPPATVSDAILQEIVRDLNGIRREIAFSRAYRSFVDQAERTWKEGTVKAQEEFSKSSGWIIRDEDGYFIPDGWWFDEVDGGVGYNEAQYAYEAELFQDMKVANLVAFHAGSEWHSVIRVERGELIEKDTKEEKAERDA